MWRLSSKDQWTCALGTTFLVCCLSVYCLTQIIFLSWLSHAFGNIYWDSSCILAFLTGGILWISSQNHTRSRVNSSFTFNNCIQICIRISALIINSSLQISEWPLLGSSTGSRERACEVPPKPQHSSVQKKPGKATLRGLPTRSQHFQWVCPSQEWNEIRECPLCVWLFTQRVRFVTSLR